MGEQHRAGAVGYRELFEKAATSLAPGQIDVEAAWLEHLDRVAGTEPAPAPAAGGASPPRQGWHWPAVAVLVCVIALAVAVLALAPGGSRPRATRSVTTEGHRSFTPASTEPSRLVVAAYSGNSLGASLDLVSSQTGALETLRTFGSGFTNNGLTESLDGHYAYVTVIRGRQILIERVSIRGTAGTPPASTKVVARGEEPALSPDGRLLAYAGDEGSQSSLFVRDLGSGRSRSIDLAGLLGSTGSLTDASIVFTGDGSHVVILPGGTGTLAGTTTSTRSGAPSRCGDRLASGRSCLIVVKVPGSGPLTAAGVAVDEPRNLPPMTLGTDWSRPDSALLGVQLRHSTVVDRVDLKGSAAASLERELTLPPVLPMTFDPLGKRIVYLSASSPHDLWVGDITGGHLTRPRRLMSSPNLGAAGW